MKILKGSGFAMEIASYDDLLKAAEMQREAQRLLFVFTSAELPDGSSGVQKEKFLAGQGGALTPVMCVDKLPAELGTFSALLEESRETGMRWDIVFVAAMSGNAGIAPSSDEAEQPLMLMVEAIKNGNIANFLPFNTDGELVRLAAC
jgi:hypothetical protein